MTLDTLSANPRSTVAVPEAACSVCQGWGTYERRSSRGVSLGSRYCRCRKGIAREAIDLARSIGNQSVIDEWNRRNWPLSADLMINPAEIGSRPPGRRPTEIVELD